MDLSDFGCYMAAIFGIVCLMPILWFACCQASLIQFFLNKLYLPCTIRVHKSTGLDEDEDYTTNYPLSKKDPFRFNVDVNIDGNIIKYHGRY